MTITELPNNYEVIVLISEKIDYVEFCLHEKRVGPRGIPIATPSVCSPLGPTLVNLFFCHHEQRWLGDCPLEFKLLNYPVELFLNYLNNKQLIKKKQFAGFPGCSCYEE